MSDLRTAVDAEISAFTPATVPPFDELASRTRVRDRRRAATGGAAVLSAIALSAAVLVPSLGGGRDELPTVATPPGPTANSDADVDALPVPPQDPIGAEVCKDSGNGGQCYDVGSFQAERLAAALATGGLRQPDAAECPASPAWFHRVRFVPAVGGLEPWAWAVPSAACVPMTVDGTRLDLDEEARAVIAGIWDSAGLIAVDETTTGRKAPSAPRDGTDR